MTTLADKSLLSGGDNKPPMLEKHLYDSWKSRMELYMMNRPHGRMILASVEKGPLVWPSITEDGVTRLKEYVELTPAEAIQADCDIKAINIILQGLPTEIYALVSQHLVARNQTNGIAGTRDNIVADVGVKSTDVDESAASIKMGRMNKTQEVSLKGYINKKNVPNVSLMDDNTGIFAGAYDDEDVGGQADLNNLETTINTTTSPMAQTRRWPPIAHTQLRGTRPATRIPGKRAIGTKWVLRNKKDDRGIVVRNKARLVAQGYTQEEDINYDEVFTPVARIEAIKLFFVYASYMGFIVYQMDVKSAFLYGNIEEEVYVCQPPGFEDPQFPDKVYKVEKDLYGLHQAPRAWYETLSTYLLENGFRRGTIDKILFIKKDKSDILLVQVYVDDIIFGSTKKTLCLQVQQKEDGIFISQNKYVADILKKFDYVTVKTASTPIEPNKALVKDEKADNVNVQLYKSMIGSLMYLTASRPDITFTICACARDSPFDLEAFLDNDYADASLDRKSTTGGRDTKIPQSSGPPIKVGDEAVHKELGDRMERDATTASSLEAEQDSVNTLGSGEDNMKLMELMAHYTKLSELFWQTATASTLKDGDMGITATIDGKVKVVFEASIRRHLKLEDSDGISTLSTVKKFEQLALMGFVSNSDSLTFQKGHFSPQWKFLIHTILHCLSSKKTAWEQFSSNIATAIICLATNRTFNFSKLIFEAMVKNLDMEKQVKSSKLEDRSGLVISVMLKLELEDPSKIGRKIVRLITMREITLGVLLSARTLAAHIPDSVVLAEPDMDNGSPDNMLKNKLNLKDYKKKELHKKKLAEQLSMKK
ncbi:putative ribonuclease H-like domain-containing protein [Tanacetum coccineum]